MFRRLVKQRKAKQFRYIARYGDRSKFNLIYRSVGRMSYAESYVEKKFDKKKRFLDNRTNDLKKAANEKERQHAGLRPIYRPQYNSSKRVLLILCALVLLILMLFGFNLTAVFGKIL